jgi:hypothetical protein
MSAATALDESVMFKCGKHAVLIPVLRVEAKYSLILQLKRSVILASAKKKNYFIVARI